MSLNQTLEGFMKYYEKQANSKDFNNVSPLISQDAYFWFTDGSYRGLKEIRSAFEETWETIEDDDYSISDIKWLTKSESQAACIYSFTTRGSIKKQKFVAKGRGTTVLKKIDGEWKVVHEHLSFNPIMNKK